MRIACLSTSLRSASVSRQLLRLVANRLSSHDCEVDWYDIRDLPRWFYLEEDGESIPPAFSDLETALSEHAGCVIAMPVHLYSMSGATKNLLDCVGDGLIHKPVAAVTAAGSIRSHLAVRDLMAALMLEFHAYVFPHSVQATEDSIESPELAQRVALFAAHFAVYAKQLAGLDRSLPKTTEF